MRPVRERSPAADDSSSAKRRLPQHWTAATEVTPWLASVLGPRGCVVKVANDPNGDEADIEVEFDGRRCAFTFDNLSYWTDIAPRDKLAHSVMTMLRDSPAGSWGLNLGGFAEASEMERLDPFA